MFGRGGGGGPVARFSPWRRSGNDAYFLNGNVGIDVTDPDTKLEIFNAGTQLKLSFDDTDNATFAVNTSGFLTITPSGGLTLIPNNSGLVIGHTAQLSTGSITAEFQVLGTENNDSAISIGRWSANVSATTLTFYKSRNATIGSNTAVNSGDNLGLIRAYGDDGTDDDTESSRILFDTEGTIGTGRVPGIIIFSTGTDAAPTVVTEAMRIDSSQRVGIGATSLGGLLTVGAGTKHDGLVTSAAAEVQTTDATVTTLDSLTLLDENTYHIEAFIVGVKSDGTDRASYHLAVTVYRTAAGGATIQGLVTSLHTQESNAAWDADFTVSGDDLRLSVTGIAATIIDWSSTFTYMNSSN